MCHIQLIIRKVLKILSLHLKEIMGRHKIHLNLLTLVKI